jgi:uncharacterized protein with GYD domain
MTFIVLCTFDGSGRDVLVGGQDPRGLADTIADEVEASVEQLYFTTGIYDAVVILEAKSLHAALAFAVAFGPEAGATTLTLSAEGSPERVIEAAARAHTRVGRAEGHARG